MDRSTVVDSEMRDDYSLRSSLLISFLADIVWVKCWTRWCNDATARVFKVEIRYGCMTVLGS